MLCEHQWQQREVAAASGVERGRTLEEGMNAEGVGENAIGRGAGFDLRSGQSGLQARLLDLELRTAGGIDPQPRDADLGARCVEGLRRGRRRADSRKGGQQQRKAQAPVHHASVPRIRRKSSVTTGYVARSAAEWKYVGYCGVRQCNPFKSTRGIR